MREMALQSGVSRTGQAPAPAARASRTPVALTIAGSDSGGGAGIQADLKAFARCGVHGASAITALTAQNTAGVSAVHTIPPDFVLEQVRAVVRDIGVDAVKVGMLGTAEIVAAVAQALDELSPGTPVVVDPVMVAESGARLLDPDAEGALVAQILPRATVLTPNLQEARVLAGVQPAGPPGERDGECGGAVAGLGGRDGESGGEVAGPGECDGESAVRSRARARAAVWSRARASAMAKPRRSHAPCSPSVRAASCSRAGTAPAPSICS